MGKTSVSILSRRRIGDLINHAVEQVVASLPRARRREREDERLERQREAVERVKELARHHEQLSRAKADLEGSWRSVHDEIARCRGEQARLKALAAEPQEDPAIFLGAPDFDRRLQEVVGEVFLKRRAEPAEDAAKEGKRLQSVMEALVMRIAKESRLAIRGRLPVTSQIAVLERRFEHEASLAKALKSVSGAGVQQKQVESALRQLGLTNADPHQEKKKEMLKVVLTANKQIRSTAQELAREGVTLCSPRRPSPAA